MVGNPPDWPRITPFESITDDCTNGKQADIEDECIDLTQSSRGSRIDRFIPITAFC